jgi:hypothetical protein
MPIIEVQILAMPFQPHHNLFSMRTFLSILIFSGSLFSNAQFIECNKCRSVNRTYDSELLGYVNVYNYSPYLDSLIQSDSLLLHVFHDPFMIEECSFGKIEYLDWLMLNKVKNFECFRQQPLKYLWLRPMRGGEKICLNEFRLDSLQGLFIYGHLNRLTKGNCKFDWQRMTLLKSLSISSVGHYKLDLPLEKCFPSLLYLDVPKFNDINKQEFSLLVNLKSLSAPIDLNNRQSVSQLPQLTSLQDLEITGKKNWKSLPKEFADLSLHELKVNLNITKENIDILNIMVSKGLKRMTINTKHLGDFDLINEFNNKGLSFFELVVPKMNDAIELWLKVKSIQLDYCLVISYGRGTCYWSNYKEWVDK